MSGAIHVVDDGAVRTLTLAHAARRNALTRAMLAALPSLLPDDDAIARGIRVVVLQGEGEVFSSGFDLLALDDDERARGIDPITPAADALERCAVPVIAAIDGVCMGGAVELACACAIRVASSTTRFAVPAARLGLVYPADGLARFVRALGAHRAQRVLLFGRPFPAADALQWGLIDDVVDAASDDVRAHARRLAADIADNAPLAVRGMRTAIQLLARGDGVVDDATRALVDDERARTLTSEDLSEGVRAAREKRAPLFQGR